MSSSSPCPGRRDLESLLDGKLAADAALTDHVGSCVGCQEQLDGLACDDPHFSDVVRHIDRDEPPSGSAYWKALDAVEAEGTKTSLFPAHTSTPSNGFIETDGHPSGDLKLDFLQAPEVPGDLGRLGPFRILEVLGRGGMGVVLKAFDPCLQRSVAIKVLDPQLAGNEMARARFCREARAAAAVTHENIVAVHQVDEDEASKLPYLIMQLVVGESLEQRLKRVGRLTVPEVARLGMQAAAGLAAAHAGHLIHRDIKPGNILLEEGTDRVKLTDFGLARAADDMKLTRTGFVAGTPLYMAPEQARGDDVDARADLFSLGTVLYEAVAGKPPFAGKTPLAVLRRVADEPHAPLRKANPDVPEWLDDSIDRLLEKDPAHRFQTSAEVAEIFAAELARMHTLNPLDVPADVCGLSRASSSRIRRKRKFHWGCVLRRTLPWAGGVLIGALAFGLWFGPPDTSPPPPVPDLAPSGLPPLAVLEGGKSGPAWALDFAPDGNTLATGFESGDVKFWKLADNTLGGSLPPLEGTVWTTRFSNDGKFLVTASDDGQAVIWNAASYSKVKSLPHPTSVKSAAFSPDGKKVATGDRASTVRLWNLETDAPLEGSGHRGAVHSVAFSPDGKTLISGGADHTARLWQVRPDALRTFRTLDHDGAVYGVTFSPDGTKVATASSDGRARIWNAQNGALLHPLTGHKGDVWAVSFSHDSRFLATASSDGTVKVWDVAGGQERLTLKAGTGILQHAVRFARQGYRLAAGGRNGNVRVWDLGDVLGK